MGFTGLNWGWIGGTQQPLPTATKQYKVDIGIKGLKTGIEFKLASSRMGLNIAIDGILKLTGAYTGCKKFKRFYAVIYMTGQYLSNNRIMARFKNVPKNWTIIPIVGNILTNAK
ncbi:MAG: hypothetical protein HY606_01480 [Planctomycetes bacterium]|nr:hypothetical protein [Planctomycetota bacterium]